jgi:hypothetical protein
LKITGAQTISIPRDRAYAAMQDPEILARCMPGCEGLDKIADNEYALKMKMAMAAFTGQFSGKVRIADPNPPSSFRLIVEGSGKIGFMKGDGALTLTESGPGATEVAYEGDVQVGGTIAAVGQRLIDGTAKMMIKRFFDKLAAEAGASQ